MTARDIQEVVGTVELPSVGVVMPAHARPEELRRAVQAVLAQDYAGPLEVVVVYDRAEPDRTLERGGDRPVTVLTNSRTPGLAGARNTGILASEAELIAFCDDDDYWLPQKLRQQVFHLLRAGSAPMATCSIVVDYGERSTPRTAGTSVITHQMLVRRRLAMLHSSTFLFRRSALLGPVGLVDEDLPGSQSEDWDLLLRASGMHPIVHVDEPMVHVTWGRKSHFRRHWVTKIASNTYLLEKHADVRNDPRAASRLMGKIAFAHACNGSRRDAWRWSGRALRSDPRQWRGPLAAVVAVVPRVGDVVLSNLNRFGRGV